MNQGYGRDVDFGLSVTVARDCPITYTIPDGNLPFFTLGDPPCTFELYFDTTALREFITVAEAALRTAIATRVATPSETGAIAAASPHSLPTINYQPWVWISDNCQMDSIVDSSDSVLLRLGTSSNPFEPRFHIHALQRLTDLARNALTQLDDRNRHEHPNASRQLTTTC